MSKQKALFDPDFLTRLELLSILAKRAFAGQLRGQRRSTRRGSSVEFADFRSYVPGDDFRAIDWNAYARLEHFFIKLFAAEEELRIYLLLDRSDSMDFGQPNKWDYSRKVAAALAYVGLANLDRVCLTCLADDEWNPDDLMPLTRSRAAIFNIMKYLEKTRTHGATDLNRSLTDFTTRIRRPGVAILITDGFSPDGCRQGLERLRYAGHQVFLLHLLAPQELNPQLAGDLRLIDVETEAHLELSSSPRLLKMYRRHLEIFTTSLRRFCVGHNVGYVQTDTGIPFDEMVLRTLRHSQLLR